MNGLYSFEPQEFKLRAEADSSRLMAEFSSASKCILADFVVGSARGAGEYYKVTPGRLLREQRDCMAEEVGLEHNRVDLQLKQL